MPKLRLFIFWLAFILLVSGLFLGLVQQELPALVKKVKPAVVVVYTYDSNGELLGQGSGFFVNAKGEVITNYHLLQGAYRGEVRTTQGTTYFIKGVIGEDIEGDLVKVVLDTSDKTFPYLQVSTSLPEEGEKIVVIGHPLGLEQTVTDGIVSAVRDAPPLGKVIQITASISPGSSGSPVVNMDGEVIGVVALQLREGPQSLNFAIPGDRIVNLKLMEMQSLQEWTTGTGDEWLETAEGLFFSGLSVLWEEDYEGALPFLKEAVKKKPDYALAHCNLGVAYDSLGRHREAIEALKQAIRLQPDFALAHYNLGVAYGILGRHREAVEAYQQAIRLQPDYALAHCGLGAVYDSLGRRREAIEAYQQAIRLQPDYALAHYNLGLSYLILGNKASALKEYEILKTLDPARANKLFSLIYQ